MSFQIIRNDITKVKADAIVNTANPEPLIGSGDYGMVVVMSCYDDEMRKIYQSVIDASSPGKDKQ